MSYVSFSKLLNTRKFRLEGSLKVFSKNANLTQKAQSLDSALSLAVGRKLKNQDAQDTEEAQTVTRLTCPFPSFI